MKLFLYPDNNKKKFNRIIWYLIAFLGLNLIQIPAKSCRVYPDAGEKPAPITREPAFSNQVDMFFHDLRKLSESRAEKIFKDFTSVIANQLDITNLYIPDDNAVKALLESAVRESVDVLTLFTHPILQQKNNSAIVLDSASLLKLDRQFNLHGLFLITTESSNSGDPVQMDFLIAGQAKFIVGYNKNDTIIHQDYQFATGRYDYLKLFLMDIGLNENGERGLLGIRGLSNPSGSFKNMRGPLNVAIKSLSLPAEKGEGKKILIKYEMFGIQEKIIPCMMIEKVPRHN